MKPPVDDELTQAMAAFGMAATDAQSLETSILTTLLLTERLAGMPSGSPEYHAMEDVLSGRTLGQLLQKLRTTIQIDPELDEVLRKALRTRNRLVHRYLYDNAELLVSTEGCQWVANELRDQAIQLRNAAHRIGDLNRTLLSRLGWSDEEQEAMLDQILSVLVGEISPKEMKGRNGKASG